MATMKVYAGWRDPDGTVHVTVHRRPLRQVRYYNPDGFDWGNESSGASKWHSLCSPTTLVSDTSMGSICGV